MRTRIGRMMAVGAAFAACTAIAVQARADGTTERVSVGRRGAQADRDSFSPSLSADGRYVAFSSDATNLVPRDTNCVTDIFVRRR